MLFYLRKAEKTQREKSVREGVCPGEIPLISEPLSGKIMEQGIPLQIHIKGGLKP